MGEYADEIIDSYIDGYRGLPYGVNRWPSNRKAKGKRMTEFTTVFVTGTIYWAKILGNPVQNYEQTAREWTFDFVPDDTSFLKEHRLLDRLKEDKKGTIKGDYLHLKKPEKDSQGKLNDPIAVYDKDDTAWDKDVKIGNGSKVVAKLTIANWGKGKKSSIWTKAIRVEELVPYVTSEFGAFDGSAGEAAPTKKAKSPAKAEGLADLEDDIPF